MLGLCLQEGSVLGPIGSMIQVLHFQVDPTFPT